MLSAALLILATILFGALAAGLRRLGRHRAVPGGSAGLTVLAAAAMGSTALFGLVSEAPRALLEGGLTQSASDSVFPTGLPGPDNPPGLVGGLTGDRDFRWSAPEPADAEQLLAWQAGFRRHLRNDVFGNLAGQSNRYRPTDIQRDSIDGLKREAFWLRSGDGVAIPMVLTIPAGDQRHAAIIVIPGHVAEHESGLDQLLTGDDSYHHAAARRLAEAGFVTLAIELRGFGRLGPPEHAEHVNVAYNALLAGSFYKALILQDIQSAADYLITRPEVDPLRIGITGASLGGELAVAFAAMEPGISAIVFQSYGGAAGEFPELGPEAKQPHYCHIVPGSGTEYLREDVFRLLAPRPTLGVRGSSQGFANPGFEAALRPAWAASGSADLLELQTAPGRHEYFVEPAVAFFRQHL